MYAATVINKAPPMETVVDRPRSTEGSEKNHVQSCVKQPNKTNVTADTQTGRDCIDSYGKFSDSINDNNKQQTESSSDSNNDVKSSSNISIETNEPSPNNKRKSDKIEDAKLSADDGSKDESPVIRKSSTTTLSKFKEKRPEPLKLNPNLNQDIPLDLSVKSAGNLPPGTLSNIFNLAPIGHMTTLETPRIQWQDNDALLTLEKARSFSSSTNASQRARMSSLMSESPPMTPNTPLMDIMFSSSRISLKSSKQPHSASMILDSSSLNELTFESRKSQILDKWAHSVKPLVDQSKNDMKVGPRRSCSTDDLNLNASGDLQQAQVDKYIRLKVEQDDISRKTAGYNSKKNLISPLAIKSFSHNKSNSPTKFSYSNQQIAMDLIDTQRSPTLNRTINSKSLTPTSVANATANLLNIHLNSPTGNSHSPITSMFDLGNLNQRNQLPQYKSTNFTSFDHEPSSLDPLISAAFCPQQTHQNSRSVSINVSIPSLTGDHNNNYQHNVMQHQTISSIGSSNTLNTPTLISPSQLKAGHLCFQPSPTLSPISSVFELPSPSPFLMFPPSSHNQTASNSGGSKQNSHKNNTNMADTNIEAKKSVNAGRFEESNSDSNQTNLCGMIDDTNDSETSTRSYDTVRSNSDDLLSKTAGASLDKSSFSSNNVSSANDLSHLITPATRKILQPPQTTANINEGIDMDIDCDSMCDKHMNEDCSQELELGDLNARPVSVIPQIRISNHQLNRQGNASSSDKRVEPQILFDRPDNLNMNGDADQRSQRNSSSKRSMSPKSFRVQVNNYRNERFESSSAPPDVNQRHIRAKIKTEATDSCFDLVYNQSRGDLNKACLEPYLHNQASRTNCSTSRSQPSINQRNHRTGKAHQVTHDWSPSSTQILQKSGQTYMSSCAAATLENRSNSAEPAIYSRAQSHGNQCLSSASNLENSSLNCCQSTAQTFQGNNLSHSAQQLYHSTQSEASMSQDVNNIYQPSIAKQHRQNSNMFEPNHQLPPHHHNMKHHYYPQQHSISAGELHKATNVPLDGAQIMETNNAGHHPIQDDSQYLQQQPPPQYLFRPCQQFNQPVISSSLNRVDCLPNRYQQTQIDQKNQQIAGIVQTNKQISVINLLCNNGTGHMTPTQKNVPIQLRHPMESSTNAKLSISLHGSYQIELESRSDSRSSCSLDFTNSFLGGSSRPNSAASSNLASKKYHCDQCSKSFARSDMLTRHRRLHSGDRPFQCTECKQEFSRSDHLSTHMRTHTGEKPYKCKMCSYSACRKDMITRHLKVHSRSPHSAECL